MLKRKKSLTKNPSKGSQLKIQGFNKVGLQKGRNLKIIKLRRKLIGLMEANKLINRIPLTFL